jgi:hypothetical protein
MLMNLMDDLIFYDEDDLIKQEFSKEIWELTEEIQNQKNKLTDSLEPSVIPKDTQAILKVINWTRAEAIKNLIWNPYQYEPVTTMSNGDLLYKGKYRIRISFCPLPNRAERIKQFKDGDLFGDILVTDMVRFEFYTAKVPKNAKRDLPIWKCITPLCISHIDNSTNGTWSCFMYDETGAKAYESLRNNVVAVLESPDVIDFAITSMILNIVDTGFKLSSDGKDYNIGVTFTKCSLSVKEDGSIECVKTKKNDSNVESE